jgi:hypothetical protein
LIKDICLKEGKKQKRKKLRVSKKIYAKEINEKFIPPPGYKSRQEKRTQMDLWRWKGKGGTTGYHRNGRFWEELML